MKFVVLMGGPGAGKGTQAKQLQEALGLLQVSTGDLFREHFRNNTELGKLARTYVDKGELVPDDVTIAIVKERLTRQDCANGVLFDGFPRTISQADALESLLDEMGERVHIAPYIHVAPEVLLKRLAGRWTCKSCGHVYHILFNPPQKEGVCDLDGGDLYQRDDDTEETQKRRIEVYFTQTAPLLAYYRDKGLLAEVNGEQSIEQVQKDLVQVIQDSN
jgi:adenylate kinase